MFLKFVSYARNETPQYERVIEAADFHVATHYTQEAIDPGDNPITRIDVTIQLEESDGCASEKQSHKHMVLTPSDDNNFDQLWVMNNQGETVQSFSAI